MVNLPTRTHICRTTLVHSFDINTNLVSLAEPQETPIHPTTGPPLNPP